MKHFEAEKLRDTFNWPYKPFEVPEDVYQLFRKKVTLRGQRAHKNWKKLFDAYQIEYADDAKLLNQFLNDDIFINENGFTTGIYQDVETFINQVGASDIIIYDTINHRKQLVGTFNVLPPFEFYQYEDGRFSTTFGKVNNGQKICAKIYKNI